jgi:hypothetical protein
MSALKQFWSDYKQAFVEVWSLYARAQRAPSSRSS